MPDSATSSDIIRIVVPGEARPYRDRAHTYRRAKPGRRGQPVGSLAIGSHMPRHVELDEADGDLFGEDVYG